MAYMSIGDRAKSALRVIQEKIDEQSNSPELWFRPKTQGERHLQRALMELHDTVERFTINLFENLSAVEDK